jgi:hypothetical protein
MKSRLYGNKIDRLDKRADTDMRGNFPVFEAEPAGYGLLFPQKRPISR